MSWDSSVEFDWGDGRRRFRLGLGELRELQEKTGYGPAMLAHRFVSGKWMVDDLRETIRLGLVGGGAKPVEAIKLVERYVDAQPLLDSVEPALRIIEAMLTRPEGLAPPKKATAAEMTTDKDASTSPPSTEPPPQ